MGMPLCDAPESCRDSQQMVRSKPHRVANLPARPQRAGGQVPRAQSSKKGTDAAAAACMVLPLVRRAKDAQLLMPGQLVQLPLPAPLGSPELPPPSPGRCCGGRGATASTAVLPQCCIVFRGRFRWRGGARECCIGRLAVAKWFLAPPTSSHGKGSGGQEALGRERAPGALAPRARTGARARESAGKCSSPSFPLVSTTAQAVATACL